MTNCLSLFYISSISSNLLFLMSSTKRNTSYKGMVSILFSLSNPYLLEDILITNGYLLTSLYAFKDDRLPLLFFTSIGIISLLTSTKNSKQNILKMCNLIMKNNLKMCNSRFFLPLLDTEKRIERLMTSILIIVIISMVSVTLVEGYFLRKRKEN